MTGLSLRRFRGLWLAWFLPALLTLGLYWRTLSLPFFWDDVPNFEFAATRTYLQIWADASGFPYYRPVLFTLWKTALALLPPAPTFLFHALNLLAHAANGALVGQVTRHLISLLTPVGSSDAGFAEPRAASLGGLVAAALFVVYPLAVIPVALVASLFHLTVTLFTLGASLSAFKFVRTARRSWLAIAIILTGLAPYVHESGVMAGAVVALTLAIDLSQLRRRDRWLIALFPTLSALFLPVWLAVPKSRGAFAWVGWESIWQSISFFAQSPSYALQFLARPLMHGLGWSDLTAIWVIAFPTLAAVAVSLLRGGLGRALAFGLGWIGLVSLPTVLALPFDYVVTSPRLLYYAAPGAAILWAAVCAAVAQRVRRPGTRALAALGLPVLVAIRPAIFIQQELTLHQIALAPAWQLAATAREHPHERHLLVNPLDWLANVQASYAIGHEGVTVMPLYVSPSQLAQVNSGVRAEFGMAVFPPIQTALDGHYYGMNAGAPVYEWAGFAAQLPAYDRVWLTTYAGESVTIREAGTVRVGETRAPSAHLANFEGRVYLVRGDYRVGGAAALVTLYWKYLGPDPDSTVFRHVFDCAGNVLGLGDGPPLERMLSFAVLAPGAEVRDVRHIPLEARSADGCYVLEVGLFHPDGSRMRAFAPDGTEFENAVVPVP